VRLSEQGRGVGWCLAEWCQALMGLGRQGCRASGSRPGLVRPVCPLESLLEDLFGLWGVHCSR
jgi:hypothetical protein